MAEKMTAFRTEHDRICEAIKEAIISRSLKPGQRLPQRKLAQRYDTTAVTIREVFRTLENSGLIVTEPKWGAIVVEFDPRTIREKYIVREALEVMAARLIAQGIGDIQKLELHKAAVECDQALWSTEIPTLEKAKIHYRFHEKLVKATECNELISLISKINLFVILLSNTQHFDLRDEAPNSHERLVHNITTNPPDVAEQFMRRAIHRGYAREIAALQRLQAEAAVAE